MFSCPTMTFALAESTQEKVPPLLEDILRRTLIDENLKKNALNKQKDIFLVLIVVLLSENGFLLMTNNRMETQCLQLLDNKQLSKWKSSTGVYELIYVLGDFKDTIIKLIMCSFGTSIVINVVICNINPQVYSVGFSVSHYIVNPDAPTIPMMFHDLKQLSEIFKNRIITPLKSTILNCYGYSSASLVGLPEELMFLILLYLPVCDITNVAKTCKKLSLLLNNQCFWHKLYLRDFSILELTHLDDWKTLYRKMYTSLRAASHPASSLRGTLHDLMDVSDYVSSIDNPMWNEII